jgi:spore coat polysaccharide biosynthesis protein SpsF
MTSKRLPGKVLLDVAGFPMLLIQLHRLEKSKRINEIVVATTINRTDDPIDNIAKQFGLKSFRGSEKDVLSRFVGAARYANADVVVRLTADCPLIDAEIIDNTILELVNHSNECDYASNVIHRTYPRGLDVEVFFSDTLFRLDRLAQSKLDREHVTTYIRSGHPGKFHIRSVEDNENNSDLRWTVDTIDDLRLIREIFESLHMEDRYIPYREILNFIRNNTHLSQINSESKTWEPIQKNL